MELIKDLSLDSDKKVELYKISGEKTSKKILIVGVFHGEEPQGFWAINDYFFNGKNLNAKNNIYIIPCLNPDGMAKNIRQNSNGVDLNRNLPTKNWAKSEKNSEYYGGTAPGSEKETKFIVEVIESINPDFILTLHSPFAIVNYDGDAKFEAQKISDLCKYPIQADIGYPTPGSFGTYCGVERKIPTVTLEFDENENKSTILEKSRKIFDWLLGEY